MVLVGKRDVRINNPEPALKNTHRLVAGKVMGTDTLNARAYVVLETWTDFCWEPTGRND